MEERLNIATAVVGRKGTGKSTFLERLAVAYPASKRVVIIDVNGSPAYANHPKVDYAELARLRAGVVRFYDPDHARMMAFLATNFRNGLIVFEDCTKYIDANPQKEVKAFLVDHRMWNVDLVFTFHAIEFVPKWFWKMLTAVTIFKTQDVLTGRDNEFMRRVPNWATVRKAWEKVMKHKNEYYNITVQTLI